ncbi:hypothetical protein C2S51_023397 [Perilla frutescens var. frutescens]|nr:hypothetical protein C2S51_023397 [Perilla frutescens var. frutescens]
MKSPRGADLKAKKMKKSGSIKRPKHPGKPPPPPAVCRTPNYMKSTSSSDARREQSQVKAAAKPSGRKATKRTLTKNPSFKPARKCDPVVIICENLDSQRPTCSSTLKDCKFPAYLSLESNGTSAIKVCPYTYCSLNGHHHAPLPPLKCFVSARRRAIKTHRIVNLGVVVDDDDDGDLKSSTVSPVAEEMNKDFFVEIFTADGAGIDAEERGSSDFDSYEGVDGGQINKEEFLNESSSPNVDFYEHDSDGSEMDWETGYCSPLQLDYGYECSPQAEVEPDPEADVIDDQIIKEELIVKDFCFDEVLVDDASQESFDEEGFSSDAFSSSDDDESTGVYGDLQSLSTINTSESIQVVVEEAEGARPEENHALLECKTSGTDLHTGNQDHEASFDDLDYECLSNQEAVVVTGDEVTEAEHGIFRNAKGENAKEQETEDITLLHFTANSKKLAQDGDELGAFNPRAPNFLPLQPDPEAQKVDLRHQDLDERKNSEEWMVDYALRQVVTKLGPARKRKVALLVEAFEKVIPTTKYDLHLRHGSAFDQARPIQACS